jgi:peptide/nickel transport system permease protein
MRLLLGNLGRSVAVMVVVTFMTFALMYSNGPGIARSTLGLRATDEDVQAQLIRLGLDQPVFVQFWDWLQGVVQGDLGRSFYTSQLVTEALSTRVPLTLTVVFLTFVFTALISVTLGVTAAVRGGWVDKFVQFFSVLGTAIPAFIIAIVLVFTFAIGLGWFPSTGYIRPDQSITGWLGTVTLPVLALLIASVANAAQQFRTAVLDTLDADYVRTLRARGISERAVIFRHVLRNAAVPGLTTLSLQVFAILGGAVFIEQVFALPGMGQLAVSSAAISDVPMVMGTVLVTILVVLVVNFANDLTVVLLNPKARS